MEAAGTTFTVRSSGRVRDPVDGDAGTLSRPSRMQRAAPAAKPRPRRVPVRRVRFGEPDAAAVDGNKGPGTSETRGGNEEEKRR